MKDQGQVQKVIVRAQKAKQIFNLRMPAGVEPNASVGEISAAGDLSTMDGAEWPFSIRAIGGFLSFLEAV